MSRMPAKGGASKLVAITPADAPVTSLPAGDLWQRYLNEAMARPHERLAQKAGTSL